MFRRLHAPGCLLAVLSLVAPHTAGVAFAEPASDDPAATPSEPESPAEPLAEPVLEPAESPAADAPEEEPKTTSTEPEPNAERADPDAAEDTEDTEDGMGEDAEDEMGEDAEDDVAPSSALPEQLPRLQRIGWYHVLGAFTLGTTAGLLAGLAEREEDKATRIASGYNLETGGAVLYADRQEAYERSLDRGQALETSAIVVGAVAGITAIAAITLFAVDAKRRPSATARRTRIGPGSLEVSF